MNLDTFRKLLAFGEIPDADPKPGLYAWYLKVKPGEGNIRSPENFAKALIRITEQLCYPTLSMELQGHLGLSMKGDLKHLWYGHEEYQFSDQLKEILSLSEEREILGDILELAVPLLTGPLYIGVSKNIRQRLQVHKRLIQKHLQEFEEDTDPDMPVDSEDSLLSDQNFAQRIAERKINPNQLVVGIVYVSHSHLPPARIRKAIESAETLLNRMFYPTLGKK
jgi:hypothetical protein